MYLCLCSCVLCVNMYVCGLCFVCVFCAFVCVCALSLSLPAFLPWPMQPGSPAEEVAVGKGAAGASQPRAAPASQRTGGLFSCVVSHPMCPLPLVPRDPHDRGWRDLSPPGCSVPPTSRQRPWRQSGSGSTSSLRSSAKLCRSKRAPSNRCVCVCVCLLPSLCVPHAVGV